LKIERVGISGLAILTPKTYPDERGFFLERFKADSIPIDCMPSTFPQVNQSRSYPHVLRGLHFQTNPAQGKLVSVTRGKIWDVAVDLRRSSSTFGKHFSLELNDTENRMLWIPEGFAHGFCVLGEKDADVIYFTSSIFNPNTDGGYRWNDPDLQIPWPITNPVVSEKDRALPLLRDRESPFH
jgi:dTDP-4-dehydrorhamnose 3,5-epimerase